MRTNDFKHHTLKPIKKIFITIPWFLPAYKAGGPIQSIANLVNEYKSGVEYFIFCGDTDLDDGPLKEIERGRWTNFNEHTRVWYSEKEKRSDTLVKQVEKVKPDLLYIIGIYSWHFNIVPLLFAKVPKKILSVRGMLHPGALSQKKWKKKLYLRVFKNLGYTRKVTFHATDHQEEKYIRDHFGNNVTVEVAANFPKRFPFIPINNKRPGQLSLLSVALISPMKNHLLVLQALQHSTGDIQYTICGPVKDPAYWEECLAQIAMLPSNIQVKYQGNILPHEVGAILGVTNVFILPSKSENFGHAIFEALSAGRPVITSHHTPWQLLEGVFAGLNVDNEPGAIRLAIERFVEMDNESFVKWQQGALLYSYQLDHDQILQQYKKLFA